MKASRFFLTASILISFLLPSMAFGQVPPPIDVTPPVIEFGLVNVGTTSPSFPITVVNNDIVPADITFSQVGLTGVTISPASGSVQANGGTATFQVTFSPTAPGPLNGSIDVLAGGFPFFSVAVFGDGFDPGGGGGGGGATGPEIDVPPTFFVGEAEVGSTVNALLPVFNPGTETLNISQVTASGPFSVISSPASIAAGQTADINISFTPTQEGINAGTLAINSNAPSSPTTVNLDGNGLPTAGGGTVILTISQPFIDFGSVDIGTTSPPQSFTIRNDGTAGPVDISFQNLPPEIVITPSVLTQLAQGATSPNFNVTFTPPGVGVFGGGWDVVANPGNILFPMSFGGDGFDPNAGGGGGQTGPQIDMGPDPFFVGDFEVGGSHQIIVPVTNIGTEALNISSAVATPAGVYDVVSFPATLAPQASGNIELTFTPNAEGPVNGTLTVTSNATNFPVHDIALNGNGLPAGGGGGGGGGTGPEVHGLAINPGPNAGTTEFIVFGVNLAQAGVTLLEIKDAAGVNFASFTAAELTINDGDIKAILNQDINTIPAGEYTASVTTANGVLTTPPVPFDPNTGGGGGGGGGGGTGPEVHGLAINPGPNAGTTEFIVFGVNLTQAGVTLLEIKDAAGVNFASFTAAELTINDGDIKAILNQDINTIPAGEYTASVTTANGVLTTPPVPFDPNTGGGGGGGGTGPEVHALDIRTGPSGTGTEFVVFGVGFNQAGVTLLEIKDATGVNFRSFTAAELNITDNEITATITEDISTIPAGEYSAAVTTTAGVLTSPPIPFDPSGGGGGGGGGVPFIGVITFFEVSDAGQVGVRINGEFKDVQPITTVTIGIDENFTGTSYNLANITYIPGSETTGPDNIEGRITASLSDLTANDYWVEVVGTGTAGSVKQLVPVDATGGGGGGGGGTEPVFFDIVFAASSSAGVTDVEIFGTNFEELGTVTSLMVSQDQSFTAGVFTVDAPTIAFNANAPGDDIIKGTITADVSTFPLGDYFIKITTSTRAEQIVPLPFQHLPGGGGGGGPDVILENVEVVASGTPGVVNVTIFGRGFIDLPSIDSLVARVSADPAAFAEPIFPVTLTSVELSATGSEQDKLIGTVTADLSLFTSTEGYWVEAYQIGDPPEVFFLPLVGLPPGGGGGGTGTEVHGFEIRGPNAGTTEFIVFGFGFNQAGVTLLEIRDAAGGIFRSFTAAELSISDNEIKATINQDISTIPAGEYTASVTTSTGVLTTQPVPFDPNTGGGGGGGPGFFIERFAIFEENQATQFVMAGENFESIDQTQFEIILSNTQDFSGTTFPVTGLTFVLNDRIPDEVRGVLNAPASTFVSGQTFIKIIDRGFEDVQPLFFSESPSGIEVHEIEIQQSGDRSEVEIYGFGFLNTPISRILLSTDPTFAANVHEIVNFVIPHDSDIFGFINADAFSFEPGTYYLRFFTPEGQFDFDVIFHGPEPEVISITMVEGANAGETTLQTIGKGLTRVNFVDSVFLHVSADPAFAAASDVYAVSNIVVTTNPDGTDTASGTMQVDFNTLTPGSYFMRVSFAEPDELPEIFPFVFGTATGAGVVNDIEVFPSPAGGMEVNMLISGFVTADIVTIELSNNLTFANPDSVFTIVGATFTPDPAGGGFDIVTARIDAPFSRLRDVDYYVRITLADQSQSLSRPFRFDVGGGGGVNLPPPAFLEFPQVIDGDSVSVTIGWVTDKPATSEVEYNTVAAFNGNNIVVSDLTPKTVHVVEITGLTPRTNYTYFTKSTDENGASLFSPKLSFNTNVVTDNEPPAIFEIPRLFGLTRTAVTVGWLTNERSTSVVEYNTRAEWDLGNRLTADSTGLVREHRVRLTNLQPGTEYVLVAQSTDRFGNGPAVSPERTFTTPLAEDTEPPLIIGFPSAFALDTTIVEISWLTNEASDSKVEYWKLGDPTGIRVKQDGSDVFEHFIKITGLTPGLTYEGRVSSTDPSNNGPTVSNVFQWTMPKSLGTEPPLFLFQPEVVNTGLGQVTVKWQSNVPANTFIEYNTSVEFNLGNVLPPFENPAFVTEHRAVLRGLQANTLYKLQAQMFDSRGVGPALSQVIEFRTAGSADITAPVLRGFPVILEEGATTTVIGWLTNEPSTSIVKYAPTADFPNNLLQAEGPSSTTEHTVFIGGLTPNTSYTYTLESGDAAGNKATFQVDPAGLPFTFTTLGDADDDAPEIWGFPRVVGIDTNKATVQWITNEFATSIVQYNTPEALAAGDTLLAENLTLKGFHSITITRGLTKNTLYRYRVGSKDRAGNGPTFSAIQEFTTAGESDRTPPFFKGFPGFNVIDPTSVIIFWETDEASNSVVNYRQLDESGVGIGDFQFVPNQERVRFHSVFVGGLTSGTNYEAFVSSADANNNRRESGIFNFSTTTVVDTEPPGFLVQPSAKATGTTRARVKFETNELATTTIFYNIPDSFDVGTFRRFRDLNLKSLHDVILSGLTAGTRYKLQVSTTDGQNNGPTLSRILEFTTPSVADNTPPGFTSVPRPVVRDTNLVVIEWNTDEIATSAVIFARAENYDNVSLRRRAESGVEGTLHQVTVSGLQKNTSYRYQIESKDSQGNTRVGTRIFDFKTKNAVDTRAPRVSSGPGAVAPGVNGVTIVWGTDEPGKSIVQYAPEDDFEDVSLRLREERTKSVEFHQVELKGLTANTTYSYRVGSIDARNNGPDWSIVKQFTTLAQVDNTPLRVIGKAAVKPVSETSVIITWITNKDSESRISYTASSNEASTPGTEISLARVREHELQLNNLTPGTKYSYSFESIDAQLQSAGGGGSFTTPSAPDTKAPQFKEFPRKLNTDTTSFTVFWETNERATSFVEVYAVADPSDTSRFGNGNFVDEHTVFIGDLTPGTNYMWRTLSSDRSDNGPLTSQWFPVRTRNRADREAPRVQGTVNVRDRKDTSARIKFFASEPASIELEYGLTSDWPNNKRFESRIGFKQERNILLTGLVSDTSYTYRFRLTDQSNNRSAFTALRTFRTAPAPDTSPPRIIGLVDAIDESVNGATILWRTNENANSVVIYAKSSTWPNDSTVVTDQALVTAHRTKLTDLEAGTEYTYSVESTDGLNNGPTIGPLNTFNTLAAPDVTAPVIEGIPTERGLDTTFVTIVWGTDEPSTGQVFVREIDNVNNTFLELSGTPGRRHEVDITGLTPGTAYEYKVSATDANNNGPTESDFQEFTTKTAPDNTAPNIVGDPIVTSTENSATITLTTDELSFISIVFDTASSFSSNFPGASSDGSATGHSITLTDLTANTRYFYTISMNDNAQNSGSFPTGATPLEFFTKRAEDPTLTTAPRRTGGPREVGITNSGATIEWRTDQPSNSKVDIYVIDVDDFLQIETPILWKIVEIDNDPLVTDHRVQITGLGPDTTYHYEIRSKNQNNLQLVDDNNGDRYSFTTRPAPDIAPAKIIQRPNAESITTSGATITWTTDKRASSKVDFGTVSGTLDQSVKQDEVDNVDVHKVTLSELTAGTTYFYTVSSTRSNGQTVTSAEGQFATNADADNTPPVIKTGPDADNVTTSGATIVWTTDELSTSTVQAAKATESAWRRKVNLSSTVFDNLVAQNSDLLLTFDKAADAQGVLEHSVVITLEDDKPYFFRIISKDLSPGRNTTTSRIKLFRTAKAADVTAPAITQGPDASLSGGFGYVSFNTNERAFASVFTRPRGSTDNYTKTPGDVTATKFHSIIISDLQLDTEYEYYLEFRDEAGNTGRWDPPAATPEQLAKGEQPPGGGGFFFTSPTPDTQKPVIVEGPFIVGKSTNSITVEWKTDERSDSFVNFGLDANYGLVKGETENVTDHRITLTNLEKATIYNFQVASTDISSNGPALSGNLAVSTLTSADITPPKITAGPVIQSITDDQATVTWETNEVSDTRIEFGTNPVVLDQILTLPEDVTVHNITLTNLSPDTTYFFRVQSTDARDNGPVSSAVLQFNTASGPDVTPPVVSNIVLLSVTDVSATIQYETSELGDTFVNFGLDTTTSGNAGSSADVTTHVITLTNLLADTTYHFILGSIDKSGNEVVVTGADSSSLGKGSAYKISTTEHTFTFETAAEADTDAPGTPVGATGVVGNGIVQLSWEANTELDLAGYNVYRNVDSGAFQLVATLIEETSYVDEGLSNSSTYRYRISAADRQVPFNESIQTSTITLEPSADLAVATPGRHFPSEAQRIRHDAINLQVNNITPPAGRTDITYEFVVATEADFFSQVESATDIPEGDGLTTWSSGANLFHDQLYYWKVRAFDGFFHSNWSETFTFIADTTVVTSVELVGFWGEDNEGLVDLNWTTSKETNNAGFRIYRSLDEDGDYESLNESLIPPASTGEYIYQDASVETGLTYFYILESVSNQGITQRFDSIEIDVRVPQTFELKQNYPNPFNPETTIKYSLPAAGQVVLKIYNILGQEVKTLVNEERKAGFHTVKWDSRNDFGNRVASGIYIYRIVTGNNVKSMKMVIIK